MSSLYPCFNSPMYLLNLVLYPTMLVSFLKLNKNSQTWEWVKPPHVVGISKTMMICLQPPERLELKLFYELINEVSLLLKNSSINVMPNGPNIRKPYQMKCRTSVFFHICKKMIVFAFICCKIMYILSPYQFLFLDLVVVLLCLQNSFI